jgi:putative PIN family toxin of toxin-antitoxin system
MPDNFVVVLDANVLIPLIIPRSRSTHLFLRLQAADIEIALTPSILDEVRDKMISKPTLRQWLGLSDNEQIDHFIREVANLCLMVPGLLSAQGAVPNDPDDDKIIAAALESGARYIISEDKHLSSLGNYQGISILTREQFQAELDRIGIP